MIALRVAVLLFLVGATTADYWVDHVVGGNNGWNPSVDYNTWADGETFNVGDTLYFEYGSCHGVEVVRKDDYENCNTGNPLLGANGGSITITLQSAGPKYFICSNSFHGEQGMKFAINVENAGGTPPSSAPPAYDLTIPTTPSTPDPAINFFAYNSPNDN